MFNISILRGGGAETESRVERVLQLFESLGYPKRGTDWLRRWRGWVLVVLAILAWALILALVAIVVRIFL